MFFLLFFSCLGGASISSVVRDEPHLIAVALLHPQTLNQFTFNSLYLKRDGWNTKLNPSPKEGESIVNVYHRFFFRRLLFISRKAAGTRRRNAPIETSFALAQSARTDLVGANVGRQRFDEIWGRSDALFLLLRCAKMEFISVVVVYLFFSFWPRRCGLAAEAKGESFSIEGSLVASERYGPVTFLRLGMESKMLQERILFLSLHANFDMPAFSPTAK